MHTNKIINSAVREVLLKESNTQLEKTLKFTLSDDGKYYIVAAANKGISGKVEIPAEYEGLPVEEIAEEGFASCSKLKSISLPKGLTTIEGWAFRDCTSLTTIKLPKSLTFIGQQAFYGCSKLASITLPDGLTRIGSYAFYDCSSLKEIEIPEGTSIGERAFYNCPKLKSIALPDDLSGIEKFFQI